MSRLSIAYINLLQASVLLPIITFHFLFHEIYCPLYGWPDWHECNCTILCSEWPSVICMYKCSAHRYDHCPVKCALSDRKWTRIYVQSENTCPQHPSVRMSTTLNNIPMTERHDFPLPNQPLRQSTLHTQYTTRHYRRLWLCHKYTFPHLKKKKYILYKYK